MVSPSREIYDIGEDEVNRCRKHQTIRRSVMRVYLLCVGSPCSLDPSAIHYSLHCSAGQPMFESSPRWLLRYICSRYLQFDSNSRPYCRWSLFNACSPLKRVRGQLLIAMSANNYTATVRKINWYRIFSGLKRHQYLHSTVFFCQETPPYFQYHD